MNKQEAVAKAEEITLALCNSLHEIANNSICPGEAEIVRNVAVEIEERFELVKLYHQ